MSLNGPRFYSLAANRDRITLKKAESSISVPEYISVGEDRVKVFSSPEPLYWQVVKGLRKPVNQN
jgi:dihydroorotase